MPAFLTLFSGMKIPACGFGQNVWETVVFMARRYGTTLHLFTTVLFVSREGIGWGSQMPGRGTFAKNHGELSETYLFCCKLWGILMGPRLPFLTHPILIEGHHCQIDTNRSLQFVVQWWGRNLLSKNRSIVKHLGCATAQLWSSSVMK